MNNIIKSGIFMLLAHPDDAEIWCGGTILKAAAAGQKVTAAIAVSTPVRRQEAREAATFVSNMELHFLNAQTCTEFSVVEHATEVADILQSYPFQSIITHSREDINPDHRSCYRLLQLALFHTKRGFVVPNIYLCNSYNGLTGDGNIFQPDCYVDISDVVERKEQMIRCHKSQRYDVYIEMCRRMDAFYGLIAGVDRAEGYSRLLIRNSIRAEQQLGGL